MVVNRAGVVSGASSGIFHSPGAAIDLGRQLGNATAIGKCGRAGEGRDLPQIVLRSPAEGDRSWHWDVHSPKIAISRHIPAYSLGFCR